MGLKDIKPNMIQAYFEFSKAVDRTERLSQKEKELVAVGVAHAIQCEYCIEDHVKKARAAGADDEEIAEAIIMAAKVRAGATLTYGKHHAFKE